MHIQSMIGLGLAAALAAGIAYAKPRAGELGIYLDDSGRLVGTYSVNCAGVISVSGTRTSHAVANGWIECNGP